MPGKNDEDWGQEKLRKDAEETAQWFRDLGSKAEERVIYYGDLESEAAIRKADAGIAKNMFTEMERFWSEIRTADLSAAPSESLKAFGQEISDTAGTVSISGSAVSQFNVDHYASLPEDQGLRLMGDLALTSYSTSLTYANEPVLKKCEIKGPNPALLIATPDEIRTAASRLGLAFEQAGATDLAGTARGLGTAIGGDQRQSELIGHCSELRGLIHQTIDRFASKDEVRNAPWFDAKNDTPPGNPDEVTHLARLRYTIIGNRLPDEVGQDAEAYAANARTAWQNIQKYVKAQSAIGLPLEQFRAAALAVFTDLAALIELRMSMRSE